MHGKGYVICMEGPRRGQAGSRLGYAGRIGWSERAAKKRHRGRSGCSTAVLRAGRTALAVSEVVVFSLPDQSGMDRPCKIHEGRLILRNHRSVDVAGIVEEPCAVHIADAIAEAGVKFVDGGEMQSRRNELRRSIHEVAAKPVAHNRRAGVPNVIVADAIRVDITRLYGGGGDGAWRRGGTGQGGRATA